jgi:ABC-type dipeptide/oligopeptide/nickel transport system permease component
MVGDLGVSVKGQESIAELVGNRMNNSLLLAFVLY